VPEYERAAGICSSAAATFPVDDETRGAPGEDGGDRGGEQPSSARRSGTTARPVPPASVSPRAARTRCRATARRPRPATGQHRHQARAECQAVPDGQRGHQERRKEPAPQGVAAAAVGPGWTGVRAHCRATAMVTPAATATGSQCARWPRLYEVITLPSTPVGSPATAFSAAIVDNNALTAGPSPAGPPSASPPSAGPPSAGPPSAEPPSAGPPSAGPPSAGPPSAGPPSAGPPSAARTPAAAGDQPGSGTTRSRACASPASAIAGLPGVIPAATAGGCTCARGGGGRHSPAPPEPAPAAPGLRSTGQPS
jgi:hypothetical protein